MLKNYFTVHILLCSLLLCGFSAFSQNKVIPYQQLPTSTGSVSGSNMYFGATMTSSSITIMFEGPADRWFCFGFGTSMVPADVFMYSSGQAATQNPLGWDDYSNSVSSTIVNIDASQDWNVISTATTSAGQRTVTASRALNTGDLSDVVLTYSSAVLDLIWARGATADYTIAYHGSTNRANGIKLPWLSPPTASFAVVSPTVCQGAPLTFSNTSTGGLTTYTWGFSSGSPAASTATNVIVTYTTPGTYSVSLIATNTYGSDTLRQVNYITVTPTVATALSIGVSAGSNTVCEGAPVTFTSSSTNGGSSPTYQWKVNGVNKGTNSSAFTTTLSNSVPITCVMTSDLGCAVPSPITSAPLTMTVFSSAAAIIIMGQIGGSNPLCSGDLITYNAAQINGGTSPIYQWQVNGVNVGTNSTTFATSGLANGDVVTCVLTSNAPCASSTMVTSPAITMSVSSLLTPSITISLTGGSNPMCLGSPVTVTASSANGGNSPAFQWQVNGLNAGTNSFSFTSSGIVNGDTISCILTSGLSCAAPNSLTSNILTFTVNPYPPVPIISPSGPTTFCQGGSVVLTSSGQFANTWSNGATTSSITVNGTGNYTVSQAANGCVSTSSPLSVQVNPVPAVSMQPLGAICLSSGTFVLTQGSPSGGTYSGTGVTGLIFSPAISGAGSFPITYLYTNASNCSDTATTSVSVDACLGINEIPPDLNLSVFPNPTSGNLTIRSEGEGIVSASILDVNGRIVLHRTCNAEKTLSLDLSGEAPGIYTLKVLLKNGTLYSKLSKYE